MADKEMKKEPKPHSSRYGKGPRIEPIEGRGDSPKGAGAPEQAAKEARSTAGKSSPHASMDEDEGPHASAEMGTEGIPIHEMHGREMSDMHSRHEKERRDMHGRHEAEHKAMHMRHTKEAPSLYPQMGKDAGDMPTGA